MPLKVGEKRLNHSRCHASVGVQALLGGKDQAHATKRVAVEAIYSNDRHDIESDCLRADPATVPYVAAPGMILATKQHTFLHGTFRPQGIKPLTIGKQELQHGRSHIFSTGSVCADEMSPQGRLQPDAPQRAACHRGLHAPGREGSTPSGLYTLHRRYPNTALALGSLLPNDQGNPAAAKNL